jgi:type II secretory pathway pseudopilin PulG
VFLLWFLLFLSLLFGVRLSNFTSKPNRQRAQTLIELTLVIAILLSLILSLFLGVYALRRGTDRAICIQYVASAQKAMRSFSNLRNAYPGDTIVGLRGELIGPGKFLPAEPECPGGGTYSDTGDVLPATGVAYLSCTISEHLPQSNPSW